jgi:hypothetical protein
MGTVEPTAQGPTDRPLEPAGRRSGPGGRLASIGVDEAPTERGSPDREAVLDVSAQTETSVARDGRGRSRLEPWVVALVIVAVVLLWTRVTGLGRSLWWDEALTARWYVRRELSLILDPDEYFANNHVLFTFLTTVTGRVLGTSEPVLRLWSVVPALASSGVLTAFLWRRVGRATAVLALTLVTASPFAARLTTDARGYGLTLLAGVVILAVTVRSAREATVADDVVVALAGAAGTLAFPPFVALYVAHVGVWWLRRREGRLRLAVATAAAGSLVLAVLRPLLPVMLERADRVGSNFSEPIGWFSPVLAPLRVLSEASWQPLAGGSPSVAAWVGTVLGLVGLGVLLRRDRELGWQLLAGLGGSVALLGVVGFHLADRYSVMMLPLAVTAIAATLAAGLDLLPDGRVARRAPTRAVAGLLLSAVMLVAAVPRVQFVTGVPVQAFAEASEDILSRDPTAIVVRRLHSGYAWYLGEDAPYERVGSSEELEEAFCGGEPPVAYAIHPDAEPEGPPPSCLDAATELRAPQQSGELVWYVRE